MRNFILPIIFCSLFFFSFPQSVLASSQDRRCLKILRFNYCFPVISGLHPFPVFPQWRNVRFPTPTQIFPSASPTGIPTPAFAPSDSPAPSPTNSPAPTLTIMPSPTPTSRTGLTRVRINPENPIYSLQNGKIIHLSALAYDHLGLPIFTGISYEWGISSQDSVGMLFSTAGSITSFKPLKTGTGDLFVKAFYPERIGEAVIFSLPIIEQKLAQVRINPEETVFSVAGGKPVFFSAMAYDQFGQPIFSGIKYEWGLSSTDSIGILSSIYSSISSFYPKNPGQGYLFVKAYYPGRETGAELFSIKVFVSNPQ